MTLQKTYKKDGSNQKEVKKMLFEKIFHPYIDKELNIEQIKKAYKEANENRTIQLTKEKAVKLFLYFVDTNISPTKPVATQKGGVTFPWLISTTHIAKYLSTLTEDKKNELITFIKSPVKKRMRVSTKSWLET